MRHLWITLTLAQLSSVFGAAPITKKVRVRVEKPINWNQSYYSEPFDPCKPLREMNPVEKMRAHGVAVNAFRKCGPSLIVPYAIEYKFPAFAIYRTAKLVCVVLNFVMAASDSGKSSVDAPDDTDDKLMFIKKMCAVMRISKLTFVIKHMNETFTITPSMCDGFILAIAECAMKKAGVTNMEYAKYAVGHCVKMLL